jgi:hypothetical protein
MNARVIPHNFALVFLVGIMSCGLVRAADEPNDNGEDFVRPPARFDFRYQFEEKSGDVAQDEFILRVDPPFQLSDG